RQGGFVRMLAYSGIAQAGTMLIGLAALPAQGGAALTFYLLVYLFMNLGAFAVVIAVANETGSEEIPAYAGLAQRAPWLAALLTFFLLSLIGIPPTAGFIGKLYLFLAAIRGEQPVLLAAAIAMAVNSAISAYYYLNVAKFMYLREGDQKTALATSRPLAWSLFVTAAATLGIFLWAQPFIDLAQLAASASTLLHGVQP
ncbi:MAG: proton-conducting transporter membrane subunit, partial [Armatimonadota bacterium]|nr:proton-conducting transporter membrane subunit [Armatimonadota bacterium]